MDNLKIIETIKIWSEGNWTAKTWTAEQDGYVLKERIYFDNSGKDCGYVCAKGDVVDLTYIKTSPHYKLQILHALDAVGINADYR